MLDFFGLFGTFGAVALKRLASLPRPSQVMLLETLECGQSCSPVQGYCFPQVIFFFFPSVSLNTHLQMSEKTWPHLHCKSYYPVCWFKRWEALLCRSLVSPKGHFFFPFATFKVAAPVLWRNDCNYYRVCASQQKMTNVSIRANNAYRTLGGCPHAVAIEKHC